MDEKFSVRNKSQRSALQHSKIPEQLAKQFVYALDALLPLAGSSWDKLYHGSIKLEVAPPILAMQYPGSRDQIYNLLSFSGDYYNHVGRFFDVAELSLASIPETVPEKSQWVGKLNRWMIEQGVGYQFSNNQAVKVDSELIHQLATAPALKLLSENKLTGPQDEFMGALHDYRTGAYRDAIHKACCAFESTMKALIKEMDPSADSQSHAAGKLIRAILPLLKLESFFDSSLMALASLRNEAGGARARCRAAGTVRKLRSVGHKSLRFKHDLLSKETR